jgi:hypothetical protein
MRLKAWLYKRITHWLTDERPVSGPPLCDFERLAYEIRPGDVLLVEGRTRVGSVIKTITESSWTHSALYVGRLHDVEDPQVRQHLTRYYDGNPAVQLLVEAVMGKGTILTPLAQYRRDHLRICRPTGLSRQDAQRVIAYAVERLGSDYDVRHLLDLARFMFPYALIPRKWRSTLFEHNAGAPTRTVCSTMMAEAFAAVKFPVLPVIRHDEEGNLRFYRRNPRLYAPRDFDYSPYFDIIKYPFVSVSRAAAYQELPWDIGAGWCDEQGECTLFTADANPAPQVGQGGQGTRINLLRHAVPKAPDPGGETHESGQDTPSSREEAQANSPGRDPIRPMVAAEVPAKQVPKRRGRRWWEEWRLLQSTPSE